MLHPNFLPSFTIFGFVKGLKIQGCYNYTCNLWDDEDWKGVGGSDWSVKKISIVLCKFIDASILILFSYERPCKKMTLILIIFL